MAKKASSKKKSETRDVTMDGQCEACGRKIHINLKNVPIDIQLKEIKVGCGCGEEMFLY